MRQRAMIAMALATEPKLLMDLRRAPASLYVGVAGVDPRLDNPRDEELIPIAGRPPSLINRPSGCHFPSPLPVLRTGPRADRPAPRAHPGRTPSRGRLPAGPHPADKDLAWPGRRVMTSARRVVARARPPRCSTGCGVPDPIGGRRERQLLTGDVPSPANPPQACRFHTRCPKAQAQCSADEPLLEDKGTGTRAACHFPLTQEEVKLRLPVALTGVDPDTLPAPRDATDDQQAPSTGAQAQASSPSSSESSSSSSSST